ncbi:MAG: TRAP transporter substrate-binding protein DctP [Pseudooceanicola sp.]|nr:TRAP transporter substrate-binding protein DctP [Pseudooceanicola sp.]
MKFLRSAALAALVAVSGQAASAEDVINAVHFTPASTDFSKEFLRFVDAVNERGKGVVRIDVKGGPEVIPNPQLGAAQQSGLIDMLHTPAGLYLEIVPEGEAFAASTLPPSELRANGGWELLDGIYARKGNAKLLALLNASAGFHIWTVDEPKLTEDGMLDFTPLLIRASPLYKQFFENLGATLVIQPAPEVYTSLERGVINSNAYPALGYHAFGWDKFTKYRVDPSYFRMDVLITMNLDAYNALSPEAQKIVTETAMEFEQKSYDETAALAEKLKQEMVDGGMKVVEMTGAGKDKFLAAAAAASWERMEARDPTDVPKLRELFK